MNAKKYLKKKIILDIKKYYACNPKTYILRDEYIDGICHNWMDDKNQGISKNRIKVIKEYSPQASTILDVAGGCGTFFFHGLINGYNMHAIEPEQWKNNFIKIKANEYNYPKYWLNNFIKEYGEKLPYKNNSFDCVSSWHTLEHVANVKDCLKEMIRVTKVDGIIHLVCPDYKSTFEGHYKLPWLYCFSKFSIIEKTYLKLLGRPILGLNTFNYITYNKIISILEKNHQNIKIIDLNKKKFIKKYKIKSLYPIYLLSKKIKSIFKKELQINLLIVKKK